MIRLDAGLAASLPILICLVLALCTPAAAADDATAPAPVCRVYTTLPDVAWAASGRLDFARLVDLLAAADVVILGEYHDDPASHAMEAELMARLHAAHGASLALSMEMFERDVQEVLNRYLAGGMTEEEFLAQSRPWGNYATDYRPLVELAKAGGLRVVAANTPTELARRVARQGLDAALAGMTPAERGWLAAETSAPDDSYWEQFKFTMSGGGHGGMTMDEAMVRNFYQSQCLKDDTMAESIVAALGTDGSRVLHVTGSFHCDYHLGTAARVLERLPQAKRLLVVALRPVSGWSEASLDTEGIYLEPGTAETAPAVPVADFVVFVPAPDFGQAIPAVPPTPQPEAADGEGEAAMPPMPPPAS